MRWLTRIEGAPRRVNHAACTVAETRHVYTFGGYCTGTDFLQASHVDVHVFSISKFLQYWIASTVCKLSDIIYVISKSCKHCFLFYFVNLKIGNIVVLTHNVSFILLATLFCDVSFL